MNHNTLSILALTTTGYSMAFLIYAASRGWIMTDTVTLIVTILNTVLLIFLHKRMERDA